MKLTKYNIQPVTISTVKDFEDATKLLSNLNTYLKQLTEEKEKVTKPLNEAIKAERARFKPYEDELEQAIKQIKSAMVTYNQEQDKKQAEIAEAVKKGTATLEMAVNSGGTIDKMKTTAGSISFRVDKVLKIIDIKKIPKAYLVPDEKKIKTALLSGKTVSGTVLEEVKTVVNRL